MWMLQKVGFIDATADDYGAVFTEGTGGTVVTNGDYKVHAFTSSSCFVVSQIGNTVAEVQR